MLQGSMVAMVTPMRGDGQVDNEAIARLVEFHVEHGTEAIVAVGTTGESATLDEEEHCEVIRRIVECAAGRVPVIGGTGANSTREALRLSRCAEEAGADACLLVVPYYNKPTQEGLYRHFKTVAEAVPLPQILYNIPGRTGCDMLPETVQRLSGISNIAGIKEASDLARVRELVERCGEGFAVYSGEDALASEVMLTGGRGVISVTANVAPQQMREMARLALAGDREGAQVVDDRLAALHKALFLESNPIPVKWALHEMGLIPPGIRLPLTPLSERHHAPVREALTAAGVLPR
ncbi:MAG: 4-hydroxy-tetrahydrodipicolinate synthase [Gammaproteobacteria bacterium]|nr:4-hydroxy-tetrahydrodipicolinate synthase [Gammaproteobacteria bacterium]NIR81868.1 4-hydroxy-tetrahydrodipicolinate synthase [Gammaproteobacteria bacterium]NIR88700.1 4-hydroxy-tetrahydrodipicolinate synthase [Gammaproteobacteria bacterium]NIU02976.1 4-hydroxy-tetrahydrodipicolinate synthase [Gammaproteobacteria bacterium]NIV50497.1 4-hydroxy-tetrahydrodipicolinate synthase [Gammaproteobacteria bacterium]